MWSIRTKVFLQAQGHYIWLLVVTGYDSSKRAKTATKKELKKNKKNSNGFHLGRITYSDKRKGW